MDTPGHPDFIAEVERAMNVLDGAILVVSAVEGVQPQTRILMQTLKRMKVPTIIFINKVDRKGALSKDVINEIKNKVVDSIVQINLVRNEGQQEVSLLKSFFNNNHTDLRNRILEYLAEHDYELLDIYLNGKTLSHAKICRYIRMQCQASLIYPVFYGSALNGVGTNDLVKGIKNFLIPPKWAAQDSDLSGVVFAIERINNEKVAYIKLRSGTLTSRKKYTFYRSHTSDGIYNYKSKIKKLEVIGDKFNSILSAGNIGKLHGVEEIKVGDQVGSFVKISAKNFALPNLYSVVYATDLSQKDVLYSALKNFESEDPLIQAKVNENGDISLLLYGEVQKEVILERVFREYGVKASMGESRPIYYERPINKAEAVEEFDPHAKNEEFWATIGLRIEPVEIGRGVEYVRDVKWGTVPRAFHKAIEDIVYKFLTKGLHGYGVTDCKVTLIKVGYSNPNSVAADFRGLTRRVLMDALRKAGTKIYEPYSLLDIEVPVNSTERVINAFINLGGVVTDTRNISEEEFLIQGEIPVRNLHKLNSMIPGLTHGEGVVLTI